MLLKSSHSYKGHSLMQTEKTTTSIWSRLKDRWFLALFALPFTGVGIGFVVFSIVPTLSEWQAMKSWQQGTAYVQTAEVSVSYGDDSTSYEAVADYRYEYQGHAYNNNRVGITAGHDNIGHYQQNMGGKLKAAAKNKTPVSVWIDPAKPQNAVLDRNIRWGLFTFKMIFVVIFGGVGLGLLAYVFFAPANKLKNTEPLTKPWLSRREWASKTIVSNAKTGVYFMWAFALFWGVISFPIAFFAMADYSPENMKILLVLLFPLIGIGLIALAIKQTLAWRRFGLTPFVMDPYPGAIGGQVGGTIDLNSRYSSKIIFKVTLNCIRHYVTGTGKNRKQHESLVWQSEGFAHTRSWGNKTRLSVLFNVDDKLPDSEPASNSYHSWTLQVKGVMPGEDFNRTYDLPVFETAGHSAKLSSHITALSADHPEAESFREQAIESILNIQQVPGGIALYYPAFKQVGGKLAACILGLVFLGIGTGVGMFGDSVFFSAVFSLIGLPAALWGAYSLLVSLNVIIDGKKVRATRKIFGIQVSAKQVPRKQIKHLCLKQSYSTSGSEGHIAYYKIQAVTIDDKTMVVGYNLAGKSVAQQALETFGMLTGLTVKS